MCDKENKKKNPEVRLVPFLQKTTHSLGFYFSGAIYLRTCFGWRITGLISFCDASVFPTCTEPAEMQNKKSPASSSSGGGGSYSITSSDPPLVLSVSVPRENKLWQHGHKAELWTRKAKQSRETVFSMKLWTGFTCLCRVSLNSALPTAHCCYAA